MRLRQEIEESYTEIVVPAGSEGLYKVLLEILLDIRGLLLNERNQQMTEKIADAREKVEEERKELIRDNIKS